MRHGASLLPLVELGYEVVGCDASAGMVEQAAAAMREAIYDPSARQVPVLPAALGADAAVIGAALTAAS